MLVLPGFSPNIRALQLLSQPIFSAVSLILGFQPGFVSVFREKFYKQGFSRPFYTDR